MKSGIAVLIFRRRLILLSPVCDAIDDLKIMICKICKKYSLSRSGS